MAVLNNEMKILNLYAGIGGNRRRWDNFNVTAIEFDPKIAKIYKDHFPGDTVIVCDAHQYLLDHFSEFDFIWASPPCPTHSDIRRMGVDIGQVKAVYPDMKLYQEIILLTHFFKGKWVVENVKPYYKPLMGGYYERARHLFWSNFYIHEYKGVCQDIAKGNMEIWKEKTGFNLDKYKGIDKRKTYRNCVDSELGLHVFESAFKNIQESFL